MCIQLGNKVIIYLYLYIFIGNFIILIYFIKEIVT
jgi:hypothetical protein